MVGKYIVKAMERVLQFKSHLRVECLEVGVFLVGEGRHHLLTGPIYTRLAPLVDGRRTVQQLVKALDGQISAPEVYFAVEQLVEDGYLVPVSSMALGAAAFWDALEVDPHAASAALEALPVGVQALGTSPRSGMLVHPAPAGVSSPPRSAMAARSASGIQ